MQKSLQQPESVLPPKPRLSGEPLADRISQKRWAAMDDREIVSHAQETIDRGGIVNRKRFKQAFGGLHETLRQRGLLGEIRFKSDGRAWARYSDDELVAHAQGIVDTKGLLNQAAFEKADSGLHQTLKHRGLIGRVKFEKTKPPGRDWTAMGDEELTGYARASILENSITARSQLKEHDAGLYEILRKRSLLGNIGLDVEGADWSGKTGDELLAIARKAIEDGARRIKDLRIIGPAFVKALQREGLAGKVRSMLIEAAGGDRPAKAGEKPGRMRLRISSEELLGLAKKLICEKGIETAEGLREANAKLYWLLYKRKLVRELGLKIKEIGRWLSLSDKELIDHTVAYIKENDVRTRSELKDRNPGLYEINRKRGLMDSLGLEKNENDWSSMGEDNLVMLAQSIVNGDGIRKKSGLEKNHPQLYDALRKRGLLGQVSFPETRVERKWGRMSDEGLMRHAQEFIDLEGIRNRSSLMRIDLGLYYALTRRNMLDWVEFEEAPLERKPKGFYQAMDDAALIEYATKLMQENGIRTRSGLMAHSSRLYKFLSDRNLLGAIEFEKQRREARGWESVSDDNLVGMAMRMLIGLGTERAGDLKDADPGLYEILRKRGLLPRVYALAAESKGRADAAQLLEAVDMYTKEDRGDEEGEDEGGLLDALELYTESG
jgi:hypothetical protein